MAAVTILGGNYSARDSYEYIENNPMLSFINKGFFISQMNLPYTTIAEKAKANTEFYAARDNLYSQRINNVQDIKSWDYNIPFNLNGDIAGIQHNINAWNTLGNLNNGILYQGGNILAFDTETIGDFSGKSLYNTGLSEKELAMLKRQQQVAGITEIGFDIEHFKGTKSKNYGGARKIDSPHGSFFFGIDSEQKAWLESVLEKKVNGEILNDTENSAMERMSRYSTLGDHGFRTFEDTWQGKTYTFVDRINVSNQDSVADIRSGIEATSRLYKANRDEQIQEVFGFINNFSENGKQRVVTGYNLDYDIRVANLYAKNKNLQEFKGFSKSFQYADAMQGIRAYAQANNITVPYIVKQINPHTSNKRLSALEALTEAITGSTNFADSDAHDAFFDSEATLKLFTHIGTDSESTKHLNLIQRVFGLSESLKDSDNIINLSENLIKINSKGNDRRRDIVVIDDQFTTRYQTTNQYWKFAGIGDTDYTGLEIDGKTLIETQNMRIARFDSIDGSGATLYKAFVSDDEFRDYIAKNTSIVDKNLVDVRLQSQIHDKDIARRVIDGFFDVGTVSKSSGIDKGGFADFQNYYKMYKDLASLSEDAVISMHLKDIGDHDITTAQELLSNIGVGNNIENVLQYADEHQITSVSSHLRSSKKSKSFDAHTAAIKSYDERKIMQEVFNMFENNQSLFDYADETLSGLNNNIIKTHVFQTLRDNYLKSDASITNILNGYTIDDLQSVTVKTGPETLSRINLNGNAASKIISIAKNDPFATIDIARDLNKRGLIYNYQLEELEQGFATARSSDIANILAEDLKLNLKEVTNEDFFKDASRIHTLLSQGYSTNEITSQLGVSGNLINLLNAKDQGASLIKSATSQMSLAYGTLTDKTIQRTENTINKLSGAKIIEGSLDRENFDSIKATLLSMNYSDKGISEFARIFYNNGNTSSSIATFNKNLDETAQKVRPIFYKSNAEESSAFMILTNDKNYAKAIATLSSIDEHATNSKIKRALRKEGVGAYYEIPYLSIFDIDPDNETVKALTSWTDKEGNVHEGHGARSVLVKQGDNFYRYNNLSLNFYEKNGVFKGGIRDQGDMFLTNMRIHSQSAYTAVSEGRFDDAIRMLNNINLAQMADEASPQMGGTYDLNHKYKKMHTVTTKDFGNAFTISTKNSQSKGLKDILESLTKEEAYSAATESSVQAENAIRGIYKAFNERYKLYTYNEKGIFEDYAINTVYGSEPFEHFYQRYLTSQTGGIGKEKIIQDAISGKFGLNPVEKEALRKLQDKSLLQIMSQATQYNSRYDKDISDALDILANRAKLNAVVSESYAEHGKLYIDGFDQTAMNNDRNSALIRPTHTQIENYRTYRLDGQFFDEEVIKSLRSMGVNFGDIYAPKKYFDYLEAEEEKIFKEYGISLTEQTATRRNIYGGVRSISDAEIQAGRESGLKWAELRATEQGLDKDAVKKIYTRMLEDINMYEGKGYLRPSLANQEFFVLGDPKTIKSDEIRNIFENGTEAEKRETLSILKELRGKSLEEGTVIARQLDRHGKFKDVYYRGQTVNELTMENIMELIENGKTSAVVEKQLEGVKIQYGPEKATAEFLAYYHSINQTQRDAEVRETMRLFGLGDQGSFTANIQELNKYTDLVYDSIADRGNTTNIRTMLLNVNNINKHLSDISINSKWSIIMKQFNDEQGVKDLKEMLGDLDIAKHISFNETYNSIMFNNPTDNGNVNALDSVITKLRMSTDERARNAIRIIDEFEKNNMAYMPIQRQQMNTFQGQAFKIDQRLIQGLSLQGDNNGQLLSDIMLSNIKNGTYDNIAKFYSNSNEYGIYANYENINRAWEDIIKSRRGILSPLDKKNTLFGTFDAVGYINGNFDITNKNIIKVNADDILSHISSTGASIEEYAKYIFKIDGELTPFMQSMAKKGTNNVYTELPTNSFYLDLSKFGTFKYNGQELNGLVIPFQHIASIEDLYNGGNSASATVRFFNELKNIDNGKTKISTQKDIEIAVRDLFKAYAKELDERDKDSLITQALYKMSMPNSTGLLAKDAIVPVAKLNQADIDEIRELEYAISKSLDQSGNFDEVSNLTRKLNTKLEERRQSIVEQKRKIIDSANVVDDLNITSGNAKRYKQYLKHFEEGKLDGTVIESGIVIGEKVFKDTQMDLGRVGHQIVTDYFSTQKVNGELIGPGTIKNYDSFSKLTESEFKISNEEIDKLFFGDDSTLMRTFKNTAHEDWAIKTQIELEKLLSENSEADAVLKFNAMTDEYFKELNFSTRTAADVSGKFGTNILGVKETKRKFLTDVYSMYNEIGSRYASEVGILGIVGRYPFFNETGVLPVRIYLDKAIKGTEGRFLGPQFSILQNLDFDGDNEFLKFLGNGGLMAKKAAEAEQLNYQFDKMNRHNVSIFTESLDDSIKAYRYGDERSFKAAILKDLKREEYDKAVENFLSAIGTKGRAEFESYDKGLQDLILAHTKQMNKAFSEFDEAFGAQINNPEMIKAAIQARMGKLYIGNFSKPGLTIRNTMQYMQSLAKGKDLRKLQNIQDVLFSFDKEALGNVTTKPSGLLTLLEQTGIDTKHVHDAEALSNSSAWRFGVTELFANANGAPNIEANIRKENINNALESLVEGSRKVLFNTKEFDGMSDAEIAKTITSKSFKDWSDEVTDVTKEIKEILDQGLRNKAIEDNLDPKLGYLYLSGLYEMSQMDNAYQGFRGFFRTKRPDEILSNFDTEEFKQLYLNQFAGEKYNTQSLDRIAIKEFYKSFKDFRVSDSPMYFNRALLEGDIILQRGEHGPSLYIFEGINSKKSNIKENIIYGSFSKYDIDKGITNPVDQGFTIKELNEAIAGGGRRTFLNLTDINDSTKNLNVSRLTLLNKGDIKKQIGALYTESFLNDFFEGNITDFEKSFKQMISSDVILPGYGGPNIRLGNAIANITGTDAELFKNNVLEINAKVQYGIEHGMVTGSTDAKQLIRSINHSIAQNPKESIGKLNQTNTSDLIKLYLSGSGAGIVNDEFLGKSFDKINLSNTIANEINQRIALRDQRMVDIASKYYDAITNKSIEQSIAFDNVQNHLKQEIDDTSKDIFGSLRKAGDINAQKREMLYRFNWQQLNPDDNFIISPKNDTMIHRGGMEGPFGSAKIGFGQFIGTDIRDITADQKLIIENELSEILPNIQKTSKDITLEELAALNTNELLKQFSAKQDIVLDFRSADTLRETYKTIYNPEELESIAQDIANEAINKSRKEANEETLKQLGKKTFFKDGLKELTKNILPDAKYFKIGAGIAGGTALIGLVGHALFTDDSNNNVEVPTSIENNINRNYKNKSELEYRKIREAKETNKQHYNKKHIAPPSIPKRKTIYHDAGSGFNFKISANSYNKLQAESYNNMASQSGINNNKVNITRDNSKITDNWLQNKFADLME